MKHEILLYSVVQCIFILGVCHCAEYGGSGPGQCEEPQVELDPLGLVGPTRAAHNFDDVQIYTKLISNQV